MKNININRLWILWIAFVFSTNVQAQENDTHRLFLLSNLDHLSADSEVFDAIETTITQTENPFTILMNGDFVDRDGLELFPEKEEIKKLDRLMDLAGDRGKIIFIPGDREWSNTDREGFYKVKKLEKYLEAKLGKGTTLLPQKGCLGPAVIDIDEHLRIIAINSQWFVQKEKRPEEENTDCGILNETEFWDELDDLLSDTDNRNLVIAVHHPPLSYGQYAGYKLTKQHFLPPLIGSMIASYHQNIGSSKDLNHKALRDFSKHLLSKTINHPGAIIVSGHEYDTQLLENEGSYFINSGGIDKAKPVRKGAQTIFRKKRRRLLI